MKLLLILLSLSCIIFGIVFLIFSLAFPDWYRQEWKKLIDKNETKRLVENTIIVSSICIVFGLVILILTLELYPKNIKRKPRKKSRSPKEIFLKRKIKQGSDGGKYYLSKKCVKNAKGKVTCKMKKNYIK